MATLYAGDANANANAMPYEAMSYAHKESRAMRRDAVCDEIRCDAMPCRAPHMQVRDANGPLPGKLGFGVVEDVMASKLASKMARM